MLLIYLVIFILGVIIPTFISIYAFYAIWGDFKGAPYVPTSDKLVTQILEKANLKKGQLFVELGSGDGRMVRAAVKDFHVNGLGIEFHPLLVWYSKFLSKRQRLKGINFRRQDFFQTDLSKVDVLFLFLLPKTLIKLKTKILSECRRGTLIISHGFKIDGWDNKQIKKIKREIFPTFYYKI